MSVNETIIRQWSGHEWKIDLVNFTLNVEADGLLIPIPCDGTVDVKTRRHWFKWYLQKSGQDLLRLQGISRLEARLLGLSVELTQLYLWSEKLEHTLNTFRKQQLWISREVIDDLIATRPSVLEISQLNKLRLTGKLSISETIALQNYQLDIVKKVADINQEILEAELLHEKSFFDNIESKPLTREQAEAVITFDNRVLLVAAAGSGKTSVMVARAAYAIKKGLIHPSKILLLAFNKSAANELQERIIQRFAAANIESNGVTASTFHKFGLDALGSALNGKPTVARWLEHGNGIEELARIINAIKSRSAEFKYKWDLFRLIFAPETTKLSGVGQDAWDSETRKRGFRTFDGNLVRSHGERMIANWLYLNGVKYEYERQYPMKNSNPNYKQYAPDFYYPEIDTWHEHWAIDLNGNPPSEFKDYLVNMNWKRNLHHKYGTDLIETSFGEVIHADGLEKLEEDLKSRGINLSWNPDRPKAKFTDVEDHELINLLRTFISHIKSNSLNRTDLELRLNGNWSHLRGYRTQLFLDIFWIVFDAWNSKLRDEGLIDFEDMLVQSSEEIENQPALSDFDLILVDEFQDSSAARARLVKALLSGKGKYLLAVGDDWQSINRFAGSDVSLMTNFHEYLGHGPTLKLTRTFRSSQSITDVASTFVMKNPGQIKKVVVSDRSEVGAPVTLIRSKDEKGGVAEALKSITEDMGKRGSNKSSVFILGRYTHNQEWVPSKKQWDPEDKYKDIGISFRTIHSSKGLEADYVVIVNLEAGRHGFPSEMEDDPVLNLAMNAPEEFSHAEERRLLYVALTRARWKSFLVSREHQESEFAVELITYQFVEQLAAGPSKSSSKGIDVCPGCKSGVLVPRSGRHGRFFGCSRFPKCDYSTNRRPG
jgi:DNA helicase IV